MLEFKLSEWKLVPPVGAVRSSHNIAGMRLEASGSNKMSAPKHGYYTQAQI